MGEDYLVCGENTGKIKIFDRKTWKIKQTLNGHKSSIVELIYNYSDGLIFSLDKQGNVIVWIEQNGKWKKMSDLKKKTLLELIKI